ncbi:MAG TPA: acetate/propionate family kinase [Pyrinomonadaceae bacterium]
MNVLVLNAGSASLKFEVIAAHPEDDALNEQRQLVSGVVEDIGEEATLSLLENKQVVRREKISAPDYGEATQGLLKWLNASGRQGATTTRELDAVGHRVVHGGDQFTEPVVINRDVIAGIEALEDLAPLHNAPAVDAIRAALGLLGRSVPMVAVFDTAFHCRLPPRASTYPLPFELARKHHIRRYGFHGVSHKYFARRYARITGHRLESVTIITLHLENGRSACAVWDGQSVDTSMRFTPLEGLMLGMRSGDIDPTIVGYLARKEGVDVDRVEEWLNKESRLLGVSGRSHDTRELMKLLDTDERVRLALEVFCYRLRKYIGAYLAALSGAEAIVFGGGIGEDTPFVRARTLEEFGWCGLTLDTARNERTIKREGRITTDDSRLHAYVIPTEEGLLIAQQVAQCLRGNES